jgi:hypothetical protein
MDADAFFYNHSLKIENEILPYSESKPIMVAADWSPYRLLFNEGVILLRNDNSTRELLEDFFNRSLINPDKCVTINREYYTMNGNQGMFIRHLAGLSPTEKDDTMIEICRNRSAFREFLTLVQ